MSSSSIFYGHLDAAALQIRLVTIQPGEHTDEINCTLDVIFLDDHSPYEALSYVWGDTNVAKSILLNGEPFKVTVNLESALRHLRMNKPRTIWIDAICINQQDLHERGSQLNQMRNIYENAKSTVIWLGDATPLSRKAFEFLYAVPVQLRAETAIIPTVESFSRERMEPFEELFSANAAIEGKKALAVDISLRPWWKRVWAIQELAVSNWVILKCGTNEIPWSRFSNIIQMVNYVTPNTYYSREGDFQNIIELDYMRRLSRSRFPTIPVSLLVAWAYKALAADSRDRIFSLLGLATDTLAADTGGPLLFVDYRLPIKTVCKNLVLHSIMADQSLDLICWNSGRMSNPSWPSWVPLWDHGGDEVTSPRPRQLLYRFREVQLFIRLMEACKSESTSGSRIKDRYTASANTTPMVNFDRQHSELLAKGIYIDEIEDIGEDNQEGSYHFFSWEKMVLKRFGNVKASNGAFKSLQVTSIANGCYNNSRDDQVPSFSPHKEQVTPRRRLQKILRQFRYIAKSKSYIAGGSVFEAYARTLTLDTGYDGERMIKALTEAIRKDREQLLFYWRTQAAPDTLCRRLVISKKGYIGLVPATAQKGDIICVLFGCSVPVIIRGLKNHCILIGESYVHGIMDGEAIARLNEGSLSESLFILR